MTKDILQDVRPNQWIMIEHSDFRGLEFKVKSVDDVQRYISGESHPYRDVVFAVNRKTGEELHLKLRSFLSDDTNHIIAFALKDELPYSNEFAENFEPDRDQFHVGDVVYTRHNGVNEGYVCDATSHLPLGKRDSRRYILHLYSRDGEDEVGQSRPEFLSIEQETVNGSYQIWFGFPIVPLSVKVF